MPHSCKGERPPFALPVTPHVHTEERIRCNLLPPDQVVANPWTRQPSSACCDRNRRALYSYYVGNSCRSLVFTFGTVLLLLVPNDIGHQNAATLPMMQAQVARDLVGGVVSI
ncbi:hypothetical protein H310_02283 [Aphanomyces invadans]|uniref:Uncharacterized protein n=1 Tax=Aphanomyces invadans TaxID=157072 RepID=A0A024UPU2_9STRA|nr:hypothetical protein H310_02283 [Aphanomyces invadans]ETW07862.1 hypothetical protein H310_02283 [Aphanomyces invadans]|eukprot:XP_008863955.1 hypothetical protein H310_02283 [Aphanomyces invadans]